MQKTWKKNLNVTLEIKSVQCEVPKTPESSFGKTVFEMYFQFPVGLRPA